MHEVSKVSNQANPLDVRVEVYRSNASKYAPGPVWPITLTNSSPRSRPLYLDHLPLRWTTHSTRPTTTITSKIGSHIPPYPSIQPTLPMLPFIMFPFCAKAVSYTHL